MLTAVAIMNDNGETVWNVDMAPFEMEYGSGQRRIMHNSLSPSCFKVRVRAANLLSVATMRCAKFRKQYLQAKNAEVDPKRVAEATINQLHRGY